MFEYDDYEILNEEEKRKFLLLEENIVKIFNSSPIYINKLGSTLTESQVRALLLNKKILLSTTQTKFLPFLSSMNPKIQKILFEDLDILNLFMNFEENRMKKHPYEFLNSEVQLFIMEQHKEILKNTSYLKYVNNMDRETQVKYFDSLNNYIKSSLNQDLLKSKNETISNLYKMYHLENNEEQKRWFLNKYKIDEKSMCGQLSNLILHKQVNLAYSLILETEKEWLIFLKFGLYFPNLNKVENKLGIELDMDILEKISAKDIKHLYNELIKNDLSDEYKTFILSIKLYSVFGLDNSLKIARGSFSKLNEKTLETAAKLEFISNRREYRIQHQEEFYSYKLVQKVKNMATDGKVEQMSKLLCLDIKQAEIFIKNISNKLLIETPIEEELDIMISDMLKNQISHRENMLQQEYIKEFKNKYIKDGKIIQNKIDLFEIFKDIKLDTQYYDEKGKTKINEKLKKFLLGNEKYDNDCNLRMVLNDMAFGLNRTLSNVINDFPVIINMIEKSDGKMNIHSLLDVVDASKVMLYQLKPNEIDISLETIAKIQNSRQHCSESVSSIIKRIKILHNDRKKKISSSIPIVKGKTVNNIIYEVIDFDDEKLLTAGIDTGSCFKVGGRGEDFLRYCLTNKNGVVLSITTPNKYYVCPIIRNGNTIFGNGIDPEPENLEEMNIIMETVKLAFEKMCMQSDEKEPIEIGIITDLHTKKYFSRNKYEIFNTQVPFMIGDYCYTDFYKKEITNHILYKDKEDAKINFYNPNIVYFSSRQEPFFYLPSMETDKDKIENIINSINYTLYKLDENKKHKKYKPVNIKEFVSIIGNKDWYVGFTRNLTIESHYLPYDSRAKQEMFEALGKAQLNMEFSETMEGTRGWKRVKG